MNMYILTYVVVAITIGLFIVVAIIKYRNTPPPPTLEEKIANEVEAIYLFIKQNPDLRGFFLAAEQEGATHVKRYGYDGIAFYRVHEGIYEKRNLHIPERDYMGELDWVTNWQKCGKLPPDVILVSEAHMYHV